MLRALAEAWRGLRWGLLALTIGAVLAVSFDPAEARPRKRRAANAYNPPYAALVVDANSGKVRHAVNADSQRHPASLAKIMTLYLLFEQIEAGRLSLDSRLEVSEEAAAQAPTKLGVPPGHTIRVEDAIKALVTKSANDVAVVIAEAIAGDEERFARLMTRKARALGMSRTVYRNASGLPDPQQVTTARDQALLARAVQDRFPRFYRYFATASFSYGGRPMRNHNRLLGRVEGVDGIKTGYTRSSGFNLVTSVRRGRRHLVAVVLGGRSAGWRDARMRNLIARYVDEGETRRTVARITDSPAAASPAPPAPPPRPEVASADRADRAGPTAAHAVPGSSEPIKAIPVRTLTVRPGTVRPIDLAAAIPGTLAGAGSAEPGESTTNAREAGGASGPSTSALPPPDPRPGVLGVLPARTAYSAEPAQPAGSADAAPPAASRGGWIIQIGAFSAEAEARERLQSALSAAGRVLAAADPFTERVVKGDKTFYRARFAGFDRTRAQAACKFLKRNDFACLALKN